MISNTNKLRKTSGFTIVELLIVIVVIGILAAITIVAYNGVQNRAKTSSAQSLADTVKKKAEAYNAVNSVYPATVAAFDATVGTVVPPEEAKLGSEASKVLGTLPTKTTANTVRYQVCGTTGARVSYIDFAANAVVAADVVFLGDATSATVCTPAT